MMSPLPRATGPIRTEALLVGWGHVLASAPVGWSRVRGTSPHMEEVVLPGPAEAYRDRLGRPTTLLLRINNAELQVRNIYPLEILAGPDPPLVTVRLFDRRWLWPYKHILRRYNIRRTTGYRRIERQSQLELTDVVDRVWFRPFSLRDDREGDKARWRPGEILEDVLNALIDFERKHLGISVPGVRILPDAFMDEMDIENLEIDDPGDQAIAKVLQYLPHAALYVDTDGAVVVYNRMSNTEDRRVLSYTPKADQGLVKENSLRARRPKEIHVLFTIEAEVRFDYRELGFGATVTLPHRFDRILTNVLPLPDPALDLPMGGPILAQGTWVPLQDAIARWTQEPLPLGIVNMPPGSIRRALHYSVLPGNDIFREWLLEGVESSDPANDWAARWATLMNHWRRSFRLPPEWVDRSIAIRARRVATIDPISGMRAPVPVWAPFLVISSRRARLREALLYPNADMSYGYQVKMKVFKEDIGSRHKIAPADVSVIHEDMGIIGIEWRTDPWRLYDTIIPGLWDEAVLPTADIRQIVQGQFSEGRVIAINQRQTTLGIPRIDEEWEMALILTLVPGAPNTEDQLWRIVVRPEDVMDLLHPTAQQSIMAGSNGPIWEARVEEGLETARIRWHDDLAAEIEELFVGITDPVARQRIVAKLRQNGAVINDGPAMGEWRSGASLQRIARAIAASIWSSMADHVEGVVNTDFLSQGDVIQAGWIDRVRWETNPAGVSTTTFQLLPELMRLDMLSFLDSGTRRLIKRMVVPL